MCGFSAPHLSVSSPNHQSNLVSNSISSLANWVQCVCLKFSCSRGTFKLGVFFSFKTTSSQAKGLPTSASLQRQAPVFSPVLGLQSFSSKCQFTSPNPSAKPSSLQGSREAAASSKWWQGCTEVGVSDARLQLAASGP